MHVYATDKKPERRQPWPTQAGRIKVEIGNAIVEKNLVWRILRWFKLLFKKKIYCNLRTGVGIPFALVLYLGEDF
jgi:hypothetical protein